MLKTACAWARIALRISTTDLQVRGISIVSTDVTDLTPVCCEFWVEVMRIQGDTFQEASDKAKEHIRAVLEHYPHHFYHLIPGIKRVVAASEEEWMAAGSEDPPTTFDKLKARLADITTAIAPKNLRMTADFLDKEQANGRWADTKTPNECQDAFRALADLIEKPL